MKCIKLDVRIKLMDNGNVEIDLLSEYSPLPEDLIHLLMNRIANTISECKILLVKKE